MDRRTFLATTASCAAYLTLVPRGLRGRFAQRPSSPPLVTEAWGRVEQLSDKVWALISTPLAGGPEARRTLSNGGIVAGTNGVAIVEGFASDAGAQWLAGIARQVTGRDPTHVILTHYHGDHSGGLSGYRGGASGPVYVTTETTRGLLTPGGKPAEAVAQAQLVSTAAPTTIDLGGVKLTIVPRSGHTLSDLTVSVQDPPITFAGDLLWNGMFPNYRDAIPSILSRSVRETLRGPGTRVPGHGAIPTTQETTNYVAVLDLIEQAALDAFKSGTTVEAAATQIAIPPSLGEWVMFNPAYYQVALRAWEKELKGP